MKENDSSSHPKQSICPIPERYEIISQLGQGGMGIVYKAIDRQTQGLVALKTVSNLDSLKDIIQIKKEFRALQDIVHPNLVHLGELVEERGNWLFTMELIEGEHFLRYVRTSSARTDSSSFNSGKTENTQSSGASGSISDNLPGPPLMSDSHDIDCFPSAQESIFADTAVGKPPTVGTSELQSNMFLEDIEEPVLPLLSESQSKSGWTTEPPKIKLKELLYNEQRLRNSLKELATGLAVLHRAGKIHRDIKPSNILVEKSGRLVLLDFGVVAQLNQRTGEHVVGTMTYMAPEQALAEPLDAKADWYSVGVLLFQAMTGQLPYRADASGLKHAKTKFDAPSPRLWSDLLPDDLVQLCERLLLRDPTQRPDEDEILTILGVDREWLQAWFHSEGGQRHFVGRKNEQEILRKSCLMSQLGEMKTVLVEGESGVGKTELINHFLLELMQREPVILLRGRCHEKEFIPFNAFDMMMDDLAHYLQLRSLKKVRRYLLKQSGLLQLFPALQVVVHDAALKSEEPQADRVPNRLKAFDAFCSLLIRLSRYQPVVLVIDDLHWADTDSLALLGRILCTRKARILLLVTLRPTENRSGAQLFDSAQGLVEKVDLGPLHEQDATKLASELLQDYKLLQIKPKQIVADCGGHPFFIEEMIRYLAHGHVLGQTAMLDEAIWQRVKALTDKAEQVLFYLIAANKPLTHRMTAQAVELPPREYIKYITDLRKQNLVRYKGSRPEDTLEVYHDRIRQAIYHRIEPAHKKRIHLRLAQCLTAANASPETLSIQYIRGGQLQRGAEHAIEAASRATESYAFDKAAKLYQLALDHGQWDEVTVCSLQIAQGENLAGDGRSREAAEAFLLAAKSDTIDRQQSLDLLRKTAEQLLMGGHLAQGLKASKAVLKEVGLKLPASSLSALLRILSIRMILNLRGLGWKMRNQDQIANETLYKIDVCWSLAAGLGMVNPIRGAVFSTLLPVLSLRAGEPFRVSRGLCAMAYSEAGFGKIKNSERLLAATKEAARIHGSDLAQFYSWLAQTGFAFIAQNDWQQCLSNSEKGRAYWKQARKGRRWELDILDQFACWSLMLMGSTKELKRRVTNKIQLARDTGNRYVEVAFRICFPVTYLADDDYQTARRDVLDALASWIPESQVFGSQHYWATKSINIISLYSGDLQTDAKWLDEHWRAWRRSVWAHMGIIQVESIQMQGFLSLARAWHAERNRSNKKKLISTINRYLLKLQRHPFPISSLIDLQLRAGLACYCGQRQRLIQYLEKLLVEFGKRNMLTGLAATQLRLSRALGGSQGEALYAQSQKLFRQCQIKRPDRYADMLLPATSFEHQSSK